MSSPAATEIIVPAVLRGELVTGDLVRYGGRSEDTSFLAPDPVALLGRLPLRDPSLLHELYEISFDEIVAFLSEVGRHLSPATNPTMQEAVDQAEAFSDQTPPLVRAAFAQLPSLFSEDTIREIAETTVGIAYLEGWVERRMRDGRTAAIRAMGARTVHIVAGNSPVISALSILRNAILRSDAIIKAPSNDPLTAVAIARAMAAVDASHPLTRHLAVAYWKGGDSAVEAQLYRPQNVEKIIAWGGFASVTHVQQYVTPGLELIALDPKRSATIIGPEAFTDDATLGEVARRAATDVGALNQLGCVNARVIYAVASPHDADRLGELVYAELQRLPEPVSTSARRFDPRLRANLDALRASPDFYRVIGGVRGEGAVIISRYDEPVEFHRALRDRVANVVAIAAAGDVLPRISAWTQTVGVYPESLKRELRDALAMHGAQRIVSLGYAADPNVALPQDALEPVRRMAKWIVDERCDPAVTPPLWERA
jgi:hypothetical protein